MTLITQLKILKKELKDKTLFLKIDFAKSKICYIIKNSCNFAPLLGKNAFGQNTKSIHNNKKI